MINNRVAVFILLLFSPMSVAGPDEITSYFMNQKVTLFDWGMHRLQLSLEKVISIHDEFDDPIISYIWEDDKIEVLIVNKHQYQYEDLVKAQEICKEVLV